MSGFKFGICFIKANTTLYIIRQCSFRFYLLKEMNMLMYV